MKNLRQLAIKKIIASRSIETQSELTAILMEEGYNVTQATISRDIKDLMLIKTPDATGKYRYSLPESSNALPSREKTLKSIRNTIITMTLGGNIGVIKTLPGTASGVAYALDRMDLPEILGTVAGDDTIFVCFAHVSGFEKLRNRIKMDKKEKAENEEAVEQE